MNMREFAKKISVNEGLKVNLSIAQIAEVLKWASVICYEDAATDFNFKANGKKVAKRLAKGKP